MYQCGKSEKKHNMWISFHQLIFLGSDKEQECPLPACTCHFHSKTASRYASQPFSAARRRPDGEGRKLQQCKVNALPVPKTS